MTRAPQATDSMRPVLAIFAVALLVRLALFPWFVDLPMAGDEKYYWDTASGRWFLRLVRPPMWTWVLVGPGSFGGELWIGRLTTVVIGAVAASAVFLLARRAFGQ